MEDCFKEIHEVEAAIMDRLRINNSRKISPWANIYLSLLVIIPILIIFINF